MVPGADPPRPSPWRPRWIAAGSLVLVTLLYGGTVGHPFVIDDLPYIVENPAVQQTLPLGSYLTDRATVASDEELQVQSWRPLRTLAYRLVAIVGGLRPEAYRVSNLLGYVGCALLLWLLFGQLGAHPGAAAVAVALWLILPVHVEPVVYASALGDHLSLALELGALLAGMAVLQGRRPVLLGAVSVALGALALLAKEMAITAAALLGLVMVARSGWPVLRSLRARWLLATHAAVALLYLIARTSVLGRLGHQATTGTTLLTGLREAPVRLLAYARLAAMPLGHAPAYGPVRPGLGMVLLCLGAIVAAVVLLSRIRDRGPLVGLAWFGLALAPVLRLVPLNAELADRFLLLPSIGLALAMASALTVLPRRGARGAGLALGALGLLYAAGTLIEARNWRSEGILWRHAVDLEPRSELARSNLGAVLLKEGRPVEALRELERARALGRSGPRLELQRATALTALRRLDEAEAALGAAIAEDPRLLKARVLKGNLRRLRGDLSGAERELEAARTIDPEDPTTLLLAASLWETRARPAEAARVYAELVGRVPGEARFRFLQARAALQAGDRHTAAEAVMVCLRLDPTQGACRALGERIGGGTAGPP